MERLPSRDDRGPVPLVRYLVVGRLLWRGIQALALGFGLDRWPSSRQLLDDEEMGVLVVDAVAWGTTLAHALLVWVTPC